MSNATQTLAGDIQLAGDLAGGSATTPQLTATGVTAGTYYFPTISVDAKGRVTAATSAPNLSGDVIGPFSANYLASSGVTAGTYSLGSLTIDAKGRITAATSSQLAGDVTGSLGATVLAASGVTAGSYSYPTITVDAKGRVTAASTAAPAVGGDLTGTITTATLVNSGVTAGTYSAATLTVDAKGRVTAASASTLTGDIVGSIGATTLATISGLTPGTYAFPTVTINAKGLITSVAAGSVSADATYTSKGLLQVTTGTGLALASGVLSAVLASGTATFGVVKSGNAANITITAGVIDVGTNIPKLNTRNVYTAANYNTPVALTSSGAIAVNAALSNIFTLALSANATLANPTNLGAGRYTFIITQAAPGGYTLAYGTSYLFANGADKVLSIASGSVNILTCVSNGTSMYCSLAKNFV